MRTNLAQLMYERAATGDGGHETLLTQAPIALRPCRDSGLSRACLLNRPFVSRLDERAHTAHSVHIPLFA